MNPTVYLLAEEVSRLLLKRKKTIAVAESCTGGLLGGALTGIPGASDFFRGGIIAYSNDIKQSVLGIPEDLLKKHGAVSEACVDAMASSIKKTFKTNSAAAITGIAGPGGGSAKKPVGLVFITAIVGTKSKTCRHNFEGSRQQVRECAVEWALRQLLDLLETKKKR